MMEHRLTALVRIQFLATAVPLLGAPGRIIHSFATGGA